MGDSTLEQNNWGAGIYRGHSAPQGTVFDAINALVDDEGQLFKRGTSAYITTSNASDDLTSLKSAYFTAPAASRTLAFSASAYSVVSGSGFVDLLEPGGGSGPAVIPPSFSRISAAGQVVVWPALAGTSFYLVGYGGSVKPAAYTAGTFAATNGSATLTGTGTAWLANIDPGMLLVSAGVPLMVVKSVASDTSLTLDAPFAGTTGSGKPYDARALNTIATITGIFKVSTGARPYATYVGRRVLYAYGNRVAFSEIDDPQTIPATNYHELPADALIIGLDGSGDTAFVFTTQGIWTISNLFFDPVDDAGNVQHLVEQINKDVVLWGDAGIASYSSARVVPAIDDVYLLAPTGEVRAVSESIRPLYRSYVEAGYQPGLASVHRGHYFLPVMLGADILVDVLVCRLDRPFQMMSGRTVFPWTRWRGHAAAVAFATQVGASTRSPKLLGVKSKRVLDLTDCMESVTLSGQDANATTPLFQVDESDLDLGPGVRPNTAEKIRYVYTATGGTPVISVSSSTAYGASYSAATLKRGGGASNGTDYSAWRVGRKAERIRFRFECSSSVTSLVLRRRELIVRRGAQN